MSLADLVSSAIRNNVDQDASRFSEFTFLEVCTAAKEYLCDPNFVNQAIQLLVSVAFSTEQMHCILPLVQFIANVSVHPIHSLVCLYTQGKRFGVECNREHYQVVKELIFPVNVQKLPLEDRKIHFSFLEIILTERNIRDSSTSELKRVLFFLDGERNPELVVVAFQLIERIGKNSQHDTFFPISSLYFDSVASYFPIVFMQTAGTKITKKVLQDSLRDCLCQPAFHRLCFPFLIGRIVSPSINVKSEVVLALAACVSTAQSTQFIQLREIVGVINSEVLNLVLAHNAHPDFLEKCNFALHVVSEKCAFFPDEIIPIFGFLVEDLISCLDRFDCCQVFATTFYHILSGSWKCCVDLSAYWISTLLGSVMETRENVYIIISAVLSACVDMMATSVVEIDALRDKLSRIKPVMIDLATAASHSLKTGSTDDFATILRCEFLSSLLVFQFYLINWISQEEVEVMLGALICAGLARSKKGTVQKHHLSFCVMNWPLYKSVLTNVLEKEEASEKWLEYFSVLGTVSKEAAAFSIAHLYTLPFSSNQYLEKRTDAVCRLLSSTESSTEEESLKLLNLLYADNSKYLLNVLSVFYQTASDSFCRTRSAEIASLKYVEAAALLNCGKNLSIHIDELQKLRVLFLNNDDCDFCVAMNGLTGCFLCGSNSSDLENPRECTAFLWAALWKLDADKDTRRKCLSCVLKSSELNRLLLFAPIFRENSQRTESILSHFVEEADFVMTATGSFDAFWTIVLLLLPREMPRSLADALPLFRPLLKQSLNHMNPQMVCSIIISLFTVGKDISFLHTIQRESIPILLSEFNCRGLNDRRAIMELLSVFASTESQEAFPMKDDILSLTLKAVNDKKRLVRQEAARCRHAWFLFKA